LPVKKYGKKSIKKRAIIEGGAGRKAQQKTRPKKDSITSKLGTDLKGAFTRSYLKTREKVGIART